MRPIPVAHGKIVLTVATSVDGEVCAQFPQRIVEEQ
jgi:hypothetical protein